MHVSKDVTARIVLTLTLLSVFAARSATADRVLGQPQQAIIARVDSLWLSGARDEAHTLVQEYLPQARAAQDSLFLLHLLAGCGQMWAALSHSREALPVLREALLLADTLHVEDLRRSCRRWLGVALYAEGEVDEGVAKFRELLNLSRATGDVRHEGYAWMGLGYDDRCRNRPQDARENYARAAELLRRVGDGRGELWALIGLNIAYAQLGDYEQSLAGNRRIVEVGRETGMRSAEALGHNNLGALLYSLGDPGEAMWHFELAQQILQQEGDLRESIIAGRNVGVCEVTLGRTRAALLRLRELLDLSSAEEYRDLRSGLLIHTAEAYRKQGGYSTAARLQREALSVENRITLKERSEALLGLSEALAAMDSSRAALLLLEQNAPRILAEAAPLDECRFRLGMGRRLLDQGCFAEAAQILLPVDERGAAIKSAGVRLEAMPILASALMGMGDPDSSLALLKRAQVLWEEERGLPLDPEWREQRGAAACDLFSQLTAMSLAHPPGRAREESLREAFETLQVYKARTLLERMHGPGLGVEPECVAATVSLGDMRSRVLRSDEVFIDALIGPHQILLIACTQDECRATLVPGSEKLAAGLRRYHELLSTPPREDMPNRILLREISRELGTVLFAPFAELIRRKQRVILAPDGVLNLVPLVVLLGAAGPECDALVSDATSKVFSRVPAASVLAELRDSGDETPSAVDRVLMLSGSAATEDLLPGTRREVSWIKRNLASVDIGLSDRCCSADKWEVCLAPYGVLHFAMHSAADDQSPWRSSLELRTAASDSAPSEVSAAEIAAARIPAPLVVLSCCESARGTILSGEGVQGLASAFLAAGARAVLATLWTVDDAVTARFMECFYTALADGASAASAVQQAQAAVRENPSTADPFYWAGFELVGDGNLRLKLVRRHHTGWQWVATIACLLVIGGCGWQMRRRRLSA